MADEVFSNGNKAFQLVLDRIDGVHEEVREARRDIGHMSERVTRVEGRLDGLPCDWRGKKIDEMAGAITAIRNVQTTALSKRQLAVALLGAAVMGAGVAAKFL